MSALQSNAKAKLLNLCSDLVLLPLSLDCNHLVFARRNLDLDNLHLQKSFLADSLSRLFMEYTVSKNDQAILLFQLLDQ